MFRSELGFAGGPVIKNLPASAGDTRHMGQILGSEGYPRVGNGNPLQYSCLENPMDRGAWQALVHGVTKSDTTMHTYSHLGVNLANYWEIRLGRHIGVSN